MIGASTKTRVPLEQISPCVKKFASSAAETALSRSASAKTISGDLPPSSSVTSFRLAAAAAMTFLPVPTSPVSETLAMRSCWVSNWPVSAKPCTTLNTPSGSPASLKTSASFSAVRGVSSAGLKIMALPQARAGAAFQQAICSG